MTINASAVWEQLILGFKEETFQHCVNFGLLLILSIAAVTEKVLFLPVLQVSVAEVVALHSVRGVRCEERGGRRYPAQLLLRPR